MKYFTKEWCFSELDDSEIEERLANYQAYAKKISQKAPFSLKMMINEISFHDGIIKKVVLHEAEHRLVVSGVFGDLCVGYYLLDIAYECTSKLNKKKLNLLFNKKEVEVLSDEIEAIPGGVYSHRILFSTKEEVDIEFKNARILIQDAAPSCYQRERCEFILMKSPSSQTSELPTSGLA